MRESIRHCYIEVVRRFQTGEFQVEGRLADGSLVFGFRSSNTFGWKAEAARRVPSSCVPVWQANKPAQAQRT